jgi:hypothetical protein
VQVPVRLVITPDVGVPSNGLTKVGEVANTAAPEPVSSVKALAKFALEGVARKVATPVPNPVIPDTGTLVAAIVPLPDTPREAPVPTTIAAVVLVLLVRAEKAEEPEPQDPQVGVAAGPAERKQFPNVPAEPATSKGEVVPERFIPAE